ncbi:hypothetical protein RQP46_005573 [Phenoliferia psychrophenolica]
MTVDEQDGAPEMLTIHLQSATDEPVAFKCKKTTKFSKILKSFSERSGQAPDTFRLLVDGVNVLPTDTPESVHIAQTGGGADDGEEDSKAAMQINISVKSAAGEPVQFKVKKTLPFRKIMNAYAKQMGVDLGTYKFQLDGERIKDDDTPESLDMEDGEVVDAFQEQITPPIPIIATPQTMSTPTVTSRRPPSGIESAGASLPFVLLRDLIPLPVILGLGALLQLILTRSSLPIPTWLLPALLILLPWVEDTLIALGLRRNVWMDNVTLGRTFAKLREDAGPREYAELKIGARYNGPFGFLNPRSQKITNQFVNLIKDLVKDPESGYIGGEVGMMIERGHRNRLVTYLTFQSADDLRRFAKEKMHQLAWNDYNKTGAVETEIFHELITIKAGESDAIYVNSPSHGLGRLAEKDQKTGMWKSIRGPIGKGAETSRQRMALE